MPPRLPTQKALSFLASTSSCSRASPQSLAHHPSRRVLSIAAPIAHISKVCHGSQQKVKCIPLLPGRLLSCHQRTFHSSPSHASLKNPYNVLGLKKDAGSSEIKKAYYQVGALGHADICYQTHCLSAAGQTISPRYQ